jgi:hypothetical protein
LNGPGSGGPELRDWRRRKEWLAPEEQKGQNLVGPGLDFSVDQQFAAFSLGLGGADSGIPDSIVKMILL